MSARPGGGAGVALGSGGRSRRVAGFRARRLGSWAYGGGLSRCAGRARPFLLRRRACAGARWSARPCALGFGDSPLLCVSVLARRLALRPRLRRQLRGSRRLLGSPLRPSAGLRAIVVFEPSSASPPSTPLGPSSPFTLSDPLSPSAPATPSGPVGACPLRLRARPQRILDFRSEVPFSFSSLDLRARSDLAGRKRMIGFINRGSPLLVDAVPLGFRQRAEGLAIGHLRSTCTVRFASSQAQCWPSAVLNQPRRPPSWNDGAADRPSVVGPHGPVGVDPADDAAVGRAHLAVRPGAYRLPPRRDLPLRAEAVPSVRALGLLGSACGLRRPCRRAPSASERARDPVAVGVDVMVEAWAPGVSSRLMRDTGLPRRSVTLPLASMLRMWLWLASYMCPLASAPSSCQRLRASSVVGACGGSPPSGVCPRKVSPSTLPAQSLLRLRPALSALRLRSRQALCPPPPAHRHRCRRSACRSRRGRALSRARRRPPVGLSSY